MEDKTELDVGDVVGFNDVSLHGWVRFRARNLSQNGARGYPNRALGLLTAPLG